MTYEEAFKYCLENNFTIYFVPIKSKDGSRVPHINTPSFFIENKNKTFPEVVEDLKARLEAK